MLIVIGKIMSKQATSLPFLILSYQRTSYPGRLTSFNSAIPIIVFLVFLAMHFNSSIFGSKLFIFILRKCKPLWLNGSQILVFTARDI